MARAVHRREVGQVALHDLGAELAQGLCALILPADQGAHLVPFGEQHFGEDALLDRLPLIRHQRPAEPNQQERPQQHSAPYEFNSREP
jgi:hypothetical protein